MWYRHFGRQFLENSSSFLENSNTSDINISSNHTPWDLPKGVENL